MKNQSLKDGFSSITDGLLEYLRAITKKIETTPVDKANEKHLALLIHWKETIEAILGSVHGMNDALDGLESIFIEFGVYRQDGKEENVSQ